MECTRSATYLLKSHMFICCCTGLATLCRITCKRRTLLASRPYLLPNPKEDLKLWYGIGILYDRYESLNHAEEAFSSVLHMCKGQFVFLTPDFDKENEILLRLGIIYKQQSKFEDSLACFDPILCNPPSPLAIWFQIGHVFEQQKNSCYSTLLHAIRHDWSRRTSNRYGRDWI